MGLDRRKLVVCFEIKKFPCKFPVFQEIEVDMASVVTASTATFLWRKPIDIYEDGKWIGAFK